MKQEKGLSTHILSETKKNPSWATVGPAKDKTSHTDPPMKFLHLISVVLTRRRAIKEETININSN